MLTALPIAAMGGVPVFGVVEEIAPLPPHPFAVRIVTMGEWLGIEPPAFVYDPEDVEGGPLVTGELVAWMRETGRKAAGWVLGDGPESYTRKAAQADHRAWLLEQRFAEVLTRFDDTEKRHILEAVNRAERGEVSMEVALDDCGRAIEAHRALMAA